MKVLFVTPYLPSPPRFGGQRRLHGLMREIAARHEVTCASLVTPGEDASAEIAATEAYCAEVVAVPGARRHLAGAAKRALQLAAAAAPFSYERLAYHSRHMQGALDRLLARAPFDVVQVEFAQMAGYDVRPGRRGNRAVTVLDEHNVEYDVLRRTASADVGLLRRAHNAIDWRKLRAEERAAWRRFDGTVVTSARDLGLLLGDEPGVRACVVPNGVDVDAFAPPPKTSGEARGKTVLFFGAINYHPNTDGLLFFLREVWPLLKARVPDVRLRVVGPDAPPAIACWQDARVEIAGHVDDVRVEIARAAAVVAPLRIGGGTRLKVLEAMAIARPVVATAIGAEGIDVTHGEDVLLADDAEGLAARVAEVLEDAEHGERLGQAGRRLAVAKYSWKAAAGRLVEFYKELGARDG